MPKIPQRKRSFLPKKKKPAKAKSRAAPKRAARRQSQGMAPGLLGEVGGIGGQIIGDMMFPGIGGLAGGFLGRAAGGILGSITGMGAYKVKSNSIMGSGGPPSFKSAADGSIVMSKREFLQDISGSTAFTLQNFLINPGLFATFPFLSALAVNFEQYEMLGLVFEFKSTSATALNSTNTALGVVIMATNYDTLDANFASKQQMEAYEFSTSCAPSQSALHPIECDPRLNALSNMYVRSTSVPVGADQRFYDLGNFQLATTGMQAAAVIGELWVSYHVRLLKPKLPTPLGANLLCAHLSEAPNASATAAAPFGTGGGVLRAGSTLNILGTNTTFILPYVGYFLVSMQWNNGVTVLPTIGLGSNLATKFCVQDQSATSISAVSSASAVTLIVLLCNTPGTGSANAVTITGLTNLSAGTADVWVAQIASAF